MTDPKREPLDLSAIEAAAKAAQVKHPGEWTPRYDPPGSHGGGDEWHIDSAKECVSCSLSDGEKSSAATARHIASASPSVVLALVERIRDLESGLVEACEIASEHEIGHVSCDRIAALRALVPR